MMILESVRAHIRGCVCCVFVGFSVVRFVFPRDLFMKIRCSNSVSPVFLRRAMRDVICKVHLVVFHDGWVICCL